MVLGTALRLLAVDEIDGLCATIAELALAERQRSTDEAAARELSKHAMALLDAPRRS